MRVTATSLGREDDCPSVGVMDHPPARQPGVRRPAKYFRRIRDCELMSLRVADRVDDWEERPFDGGYAGLLSLADSEFSGVVRAGGAELYMTAGTVVGIERGSIEDFEAATGTTYEAPVPALPLLIVMQAAGAEVRAQYYTEETPISEVDGTLSDGGFTGFVELSENVLSGDYFLVYHGGRSMAVGFVGAAQQLISGDEAFETADDEVGIYKVRQVDVEPIEIPEPAETAGGGEATTVEDEPTDDSESEEQESSSESEEAAPVTDDSEAPVEADTGESDDVPRSTTDETDDAGASAPDGSRDAEPADDEAEPQASADTADTSEPTSERSGDTASSGTRSVETVSGGDRGRGRDGGASSRGAETRSTAGGRGTSSVAGRRSEGGAADLETRSIPSLDPDRTHLPQQDRSTPAEPEPTRATDSEPEGPGEPSPSPTEDQTARVTEPGDASVLAELEDELAEKEAEIEDLASDLADAEAERDELAAELETVREERDELADRVDELESELARLEEEMGAATDAERRLTPNEAIEGTNLFVDYNSKGAATLAKAHDGTESPEDVAENLQLGVHTEFADTGVAVNGRAFDEWLRSTLHYRFAEWVVSTLLFEIRDTSHADDLVDLYDAIPEIRRVEFNGAVDVEYVEDGQEKAGREHFDVIFRHRMGDPLIVANLNESRDPATGSMMETLVTSAERVGQSADSLATAVLVTSSFFESAALETVSDATRGGILSRDKRTSFVNLSRKTGYHLCLVAARENNFHMEVPEL